MPLRRCGRPAAIPLTSAVLLIAAIVGYGAPATGDPSPGSPASSVVPASSSVSTISGRVTVRDTGEPYPGVSVEFKNLRGGNVHGETDADGYYSLPVPADVYTALAVDLNNENAGFDVVGRSSNAVSVPPSTTIDFEGYQIVPGREPVP
jgi:Carboxypeptidase regulatory-like domain